MLKITESSIAPSDGIISGNVGIGTKASTLKLVVDTEESRITAL